MRFVVDAQLPPALATLLRENGHDAVHVTAIGPGSMADQKIWQFAVDHESVIITKDEDFALMGSGQERSPSVVWVRSGNLRRAVLLAWFQPLIGPIVDQIEHGQRFVELR